MSQEKFLIDSPFFSLDARIYNEEQIGNKKGEKKKREKKVEKKHTQKQHSFSQINISWWLTRKLLIYGGGSFPQVHSITFIIIDVDGLVFQWGGGQHYKIVIRSRCHNSVPVWL